jgi:hypothetical protein
MNDNASLPDLSHLIDRPDDLLDAVIDFLEEHPGRWEQRECMRQEGKTRPISAVAAGCDTRGCIAGWGVLLTGHTLSRGGWHVIAGPAVVIAVDPANVVNLGGKVKFPGWEVLLPDETTIAAAQRLFGLDEHEAGFLFDEDRWEDAERLRRDVAKIRADRGQP